MKVGSRCGFCLLYRGYKIIQMSTKEEETRLEAMESLIKLLGKTFNFNAVPSVIGAERARIIAKVTGCKDPYKTKKEEANQRSLELIPYFRNVIDKKPEDEKFRTACLISCLGNILDYDLPDNNSEIDSIINLLHEDFYIDDTNKLKTLIKKGTKILYFTDNAGEIGFDILLVEELKKLGAHVILVVKGGPSLNDATIKDAKMVGIDKIANEITTTFTDSIGVRLDEVPDSFKERFYNAELIIAKGMANWETLTEYSTPCPMMFIFRTKCEPVAKSVNAPINTSIAKLVEKNWKL
jgi:uncharacterized protein with ATP-grasp and redox domains